MSVRAKASAVALAALAGLLLTPAAMASSGPVQFTGRQLKAALLPASDFVAGYTSTDESDSGRHLEHARPVQPALHELLELLAVQRPSGRFR